MRTHEISSSTNPRLKAWKRLARDNFGYKDSGLVWLEGQHLFDAYLQALSSPKSLGVMPSLETIIVAQSAKELGLAQLQALTRQSLWLQECSEFVILPDTLFASISALPSHDGVAVVLKLIEADQAINPVGHSVILDGIQDAGNVGSILRSSAAFGVEQVIALEGTALLWSPKVLRAAMGAHFSLRMFEGISSQKLDMHIPILVTHVHQGLCLHELQGAKKIPHPCAWVFGHEGRGVSQTLLKQASVRVQIRQASQESLNVGAAAAVCLYASYATSF